MPTNSPTDLAALRIALSPARFGTFAAAAAGDESNAAELYAWNARTSAALMLPAHFAEVTTRNAAHEVLCTVYGSDWPWNPSFTGSLPNPLRGYRPRDDLEQTRARHRTTGKVVAELKFAFWQSLFTARHDTRLWTPHIRGAFLTGYQSETTGALRARIHADLEAIRQLRNRIAHHEPIFSRDLGADLSRMIDLVELRSAPVGAWVRSLEDVTRLLGEQP